MIVTVTQDTVTVRRSLLELVLAQVSFLKRMNPDFTGDIVSMAKQADDSAPPDDY